MIDAYVKYGTSSYCPQCGKILKTGMRVIYDGMNEYDSCRCMGDFQDAHKKSPQVEWGLSTHTNEGRRPLNA